MKSAGKLHYYQERPTGDWRWKIVARNGKIIDSSSEGFKTKRTAIRNRDLCKAAHAVIDSGC